MAFDKLDGGKIVIFGGGIPLKSGNTIIGGLGISGGTGEEDLVWQSMVSLC